MRDGRISSLALHAGSPSESHQKAEAIQRRTLVRLFWCVVARSPPTTVLHSWIFSLSVDALPCGGNSPSKLDLVMYFQITIVTC